jgi:tRNA-dihydrouridine synthase
MACEAGSGMLKCRPQTLQIIKRISESISKPFSIKTRRGLHIDDKKEQFDFIIEAAYYCKMITVHGRTYKQSHNGEVDREFIQSIKSELLSRDL